MAAVAMPLSTLEGGLVAKRKARGQGEGSIWYDEKRDIWRGAVSLGNGKRRQVQGTTKREVNEKLTQIKYDLQRGMVALTDETFGGYLADWLIGVEHTVRPTTYQRYARDCRLHIVPELGERPLAKLAPRDLQAFYTAKLKGGLSPRSVGHLHRVIHKALADAMRQEIIPRNVADVARPPHADSPQTRFLRADEARALLRAARGDRLEALYVLALTTGARQGELLALQWDNVDLERGVMEIRRTIQHVPKKGWVIQDPKTPSSRRAVILLGAAIDTLKEHRERQERERMVAGQDWQENGLVFTTRRGTPLDGSNVTNQYFRPLLKRAGLPQIRFHDLRHSTASLLMALGVQIKVVSEILGHSSTLITTKFYQHTTPALHQDAVARLGGALF